MKTFQEFQYNCNLILERYYAPDDELPGGGTPVGRATEKGITGSLLNKVKRGVDNKEIDTSPQKGLKITRHDDLVIVRHPKSGAEFHLRHSGHVEGRPNYDISWYNPSRKAKTPEEKRKFASTVKGLWYNNVQHILPHGSVVSNSPASETHRKIYSNERVGFGNVINGKQYATVGRMPSPRQQKKGKRTRLSPLNPS
jgi:hypothetical protein